MTRVLSFPAGVLAVAIGCLWFIPSGRLWMAETWSRLGSSNLNLRTYETVVRPAADWVRSFRLQHGRLPGAAEFSDYAKAQFPSFSVVLDDTQPSWQRSWGRQGVDFMVCVHVDEWNLYLQSWDRAEWKSWTD